MSVLLPMAIGTRLSLRFTAQDGPREAVGEVLACDDEALVLLPEGSPPITVARSAVQAARAVPPRAVRPVSPIEDLEVLMAQGWPGAEQERLGGWLLRAGGGGSRRANSALPVGDSGLPVAAALDRVVEWYAARGLRPCLQLPEELGPRLPSYRRPPESLRAELATREWAAEAPTLVMVADVRRVPTTDSSPLSTTDSSPLSTTDSSPADSTWSDVPDAAWWEADGTTGARRDEALAAPARYLSVRGADGGLIAVGRLAVVRDWCGLTNLTVVPTRRGAGHGRRAVRQMLGEGARLGARFAYLQVLEDNAVARGLYETHGFVPHHSYRYWAPRT